GNECNWTANSNVDWISVTSAGTRISGNGTVNFTVAANTGNGSRTGTLSIAGQTFTITQEGTPQVVLTPPEQSYVLRFEGDHIASAPVAAPLNLGSQFTMETWLFVERVVPYSYIMGKTSDPPSSEPYHSYDIILSPEGNVLFLQSTGQQGSLRGAGSLSPLPLRTWTHVAATLSEGMMRLFINGQEVDRQPSPGVPASGNQPFTLGASFYEPTFDVANQGFAGALSQARVWNRALTGDEISANASLYLNGNEAGLVAYWPLDDGGTGQSLRDLGPNNLRLQLGHTNQFDKTDPRWTRPTILENPYYGLEIPPVPKHLSGQPDGFVIDFDSDGDQDILQTPFDLNDERNYVPGPVRAFRNDGQGGFSDATAQVLGDQNFQIYLCLEDFGAVADFNGDGRMDVFIGDSGPDQGLNPGAQSRILIQTADGRLVDETSTRLPQLIAFTHGATSGDYDSDGDIDILDSKYNNGGPRLYINDGAGHFTDGSSRLPDFVTSLTRRFTSVTSADVDNDGDLDLVCGEEELGAAVPDNRGSRDVLLLNNGQGHFSAAPETALPLRYGGSDWGTISAISADFNNDGWSDLLMTTFYLYKKSGLQLLLNNGNGTFRDATDRIPPQMWPDTSALTDDVNRVYVKRSKAADLNGDGLIDILTMGSNRLHARIYLNTGQAQFIEASEILPNVDGGHILVSDFDEDGDIDLFAATEKGEFFFSKNLR
ncbi:MAG TPA: FG-GAP-like repeat-containing protein, partial [Blastocatellia bacterium]|nr:FG-GAP-like repeat-containing protein [Blastocatellia bacterium]